MIQAEAERSKRPSQPKVQDVVALTEQLRRTNVIYLAGNITDEEYAAETKRLKAEIEKARRAESGDRPTDLTRIKELLQTDFLASYHTLDKEDQRRFWRSMIEEIYVEGANVTGIKPRLI